jgi:hypothetical protein
VRMCTPFLKTPFFDFLSMRVQSNDAVFFSYAEDVILIHRPSSFAKTVLLSFFYLERSATLVFNCSFSYWPPLPLCSPYLVKKVCTSFGTRFFLTYQFATISVSFFND